VDPNAFRNRDRAGQTSQADVYWRRRFFVLTALLGVVALMFWAFSGSGGGQRGSAASRKPGAAKPGGAAPAAYGSAAARSPAPPAAPPSAPASASPSPSASPSASSSASPAAPAGKGANAGNGKSAAAVAEDTGRPAPCPAADVVLSVFASKASYSAHELPRFQIDAVSTDAAACTFEAGPAALHLVIRSGSHVVWDSAACLRNAGARTDTLQRGVPAFVPVTWDRLLSGRGCGSRRAHARPGRYVAVAEEAPRQARGARHAHGSTLTSQPLSFELR
jgi:hypothetical protein